MQGDPYQRSQRLFVFAVHMLVALTVNIVFFRDYEECVYACDDHMPAGVDDPTTPQEACSACRADMEWESCALGDANLHPVDDARMCAEEQLPKLTASLVSMAIVLPIYLTLSHLVRI